MSVLLLSVCLTLGGALLDGAAPAPAQTIDDPALVPFFEVPQPFRGQFGDYRSPLLFSDGSRVETPADWVRRRAELLEEWRGMLGTWPPVLTTPSFEVLAEQPHDGFRQQRVRVQVSHDQRTEGWLLLPDGDGPFPAVIIVYYDPDTAVGLGELPDRDFARQLTRAGLVTLSLGIPDGDARMPVQGMVTGQPLSYYAYVAANAWAALAMHPAVDSSRIGVTGHSFGGKWALFAAALWDRFAAVAVSDPGVVFDETRPNVNYWEPWYLGLEPGRPRRAPGVPTPENPTAGPYKAMRDAGRDLHELHALIAPRPFLVSGGAEDPPERWVALNHAVEVNRLLGYERRVGMTNRPEHAPNPESNAQLVAFFVNALGRR